MRIDAMRQKTPSQMFSAAPQTLRARVYQTAMKAAPSAKQIPKPRSEPNHIWDEIGLGKEVPV